MVGGIALFRLIKRSLKYADVSKWSLFALKELTFKI